MDIREVYMPFIDIRTTAVLDKEQRDAVKSSLGKAIETLKGKTEEYLMTGFIDGYHLYLGGRELENGACVSVQYFGDADRQQLKELGGKILTILQETCGIPAAGVYIIFSCGVENWTLFGDTYHTDIFARI